MTDTRARGSTTNAPAPVGSEGQRLMQLVPGSLSVIAASVGTDKGTVSCWRSGSKIPSAPLRARCLAAFGIEPASWDRRPTVGAGSAGSVSLPDPDPIAPDAISGLDMCKRQLIRLHRLVDDATLTAGEALKVEHEIGAAIRTKEGIEAKAELLEARIVREHPTWRNMERRIVEALRPFPDAAKAVVNVLGDMEA